VIRTLAFDFGAASGRAIIGEYKDGKIPSMKSIDSRIILYIIEIIEQTIIKKYLMLLQKKRFMLQLVFNS
jgi:hypothetical protein